jgi:ankyrin repeat protein
MSSPSRVQPGNGESSDFSPERVKNFHKKVMEKSALIGGANVAKGIIDTDGSDISVEGVNPGMLASLLLSPTILTKRHQQAMRAIEKRKWDQVTYLINANPWLCEMTDVTTNQYLLHKLSLYGGGESMIDRSTGESVAIRHEPAPAELNTSIVKLFPSAVQKFDQDGNLPLHMACAAANASMVEILGDRFPGGATVRNEDGLLPIHLVILACGSPLAGTYGNSDAATAMVRTMLSLFPASVAISDEEGNLPIHTAASVLRGDVGVDVIHLLLDEAARQLEDPYGARFRNKINMENFDDATVETEPTDAPTVSDFDEITHCTAVCNDAGQTALMAAIHARAGWEMIEALMQGTGGPASALVTDVNLNNSLHLLLSEEYQDPAAALSILKNAPETAQYRNEYGMLPIEVSLFLLVWSTWKDQLVVGEKFNNSSAFPLLDCLHALPRSPTYSRHRPC